MAAPRAFIKAAVALVATANLPLQASAYNTTNEVWKYYSRPDLSPPVIEFTTLSTSSLSPGYLLLTPYSPPPGSNLAAGSVPSYFNLTPAKIAEIEAELKEEIQNGPYNLVYSGFGTTGGQYAHDLKISTYNDASVMTYYTGNDESTSNAGHGII
ncbi:hypothetical protein G7Y89_g9532 [Cudoniella acicularis]|uniref:Uncharacterized protein n=1 Tax=Cudoniella acicularis TaxID=354080 RepID=A0A8H4VZY2_9HELO|nr:hypothetical protein G7Y89_g9532 [Cudoniella acicularis]